MVMVVGLDQSGRTGLVDGHSTTRFPVVPAAVSSARASSPPKIPGGRPRPFNEAHATLRQVAEEGKCCSCPRSSRPAFHGHPAIVLLDSVRRRE